MNEIARIEPARPLLMAGARPVAIVPQSMEDCYRMANAVCLAGMAPRGLDTPEKAMVAILHGLEVGLTPMAALQRIAVVNGRPTIWGDGAIGLVRGSGLCEYVTETVEGTGDAAVAICEAKRRNEPAPIKRTFSVGDAKKASLWGKQGPWQQYPMRMLAMRARAFCLRDLFADVLGGLYLREEIEDDNRRAPSLPPPKAFVEQESNPEPAPTNKIEDTPIEAAPSPRRRAPPPPGPDSSFESLVRRFEERALTAKSVEDLGLIWDEVVEPAFDRMMPSDQGDLIALNRKFAGSLPSEES